MTRDDRKLTKALEATGAIPIHHRMAFALLSCSGIDNALEFVEQVRQGCKCGAPYDETNRCANRCWGEERKCG